MNSFKRIATRILVRLYGSPILGNIAAVATSAGVAYLAARVPGAIEAIEWVIRMSSPKPEEVVVGQAAVATFLSPLVFGAIKAGIQEILFRGANKALDTMSDFGLYDGKRDGFIGPVAQESIHQLILHRHDIPDPDQ